MKRSSPLLIMVALTLATLSYGGKQAEMPSNSVESASSRAPASVSPSKMASETDQKDRHLNDTGNSAKSGQQPVVIAEFPPLEIEEIH